MLSENRLRILQHSYGQLKDIGHYGSDLHNDMVRFIAGMTRETQVQIAESNIRWLTPIARNFLAGTPYGTIPGMDQPVVWNGRGFMPAPSEGGF